MFKSIGGRGVKVKNLLHVFLRNVKILLLAQDIRVWIWPGMTEIAYLPIPLLHKKWAKKRLKSLNHTPKKMSYTCFFWCYFLKLYGLCHIKPHIMTFFHDFGKTGTKLGKFLQKLGLRTSISETAILRIALEVLQTSYLAKL